jgi:hypothetical protein
MQILNIDMIHSKKSVNYGIFSMNDLMTIDTNTEWDIKTESRHAFRFFIQRGFYDEN